MIDGARLAEYIELTARKRALDDDLKELNERLVLIELELLDQFEAAGVDKIGKDGYTLYMARSLRPRAKDGDRERMLEAIKANGYGDLVKEDIHSVVSFMLQMRQAKRFPRLWLNVLKKKKIFIYLKMWWRSMSSPHKKPR